MQKPFHSRLVRINSEPKKDVAGNTYELGSQGPVCHVLPVLREQPLSSSRNLKPGRSKGLLVSELLIKINSLLKREARNLVFLKCEVPYILNVFGSIFNRPGRPNKIHLGIKFSLLTISFFTSLPSSDFHGCIHSFIPFT